MITGESLLELRPWRLSDMEDLAFFANNANIANNMTNKFPHPYLLEHAEAFIQFAQVSDPVCIFAISYQGKSIGGMGVHLQADIFAKNAELGYWLAEPYWGQGFVSKLLPVLVDFAFNTYDIQRVFARPFSSNKASQRVLEKNNFVLEATLPKTIYKNGIFLDELIYALRREAWKNIPQET
jgi:RimJ/RimL family protein N-acetyltransferase